MSELGLTRLDAIPEQFCKLTPETIQTVFRSPTLIKVPGGPGPALFVSILLHGNEHSGLAVVQRLLGNYRGTDLPRTLWLLVGNVRAAAAGKRRLDGQPDYNRVWSGTDEPHLPEARVMAEVMEVVTQCPLVAAIDLHNNTGTNPVYACISDARPENLHLSAMFGGIGLCVRRPNGMAITAFDGICPAAALECGKPGDPAGIAAALAMLEVLLNRGCVPVFAGCAEPRVLRIRATVTIADGIEFAFSHDTPLALRFDPHFDRLNFTAADADVPFAYSRVERPLVAIDQAGRDVTDEVLCEADGAVYLTQPLIPAMISTDPEMVRQDCLCYLLEPTTAEDFAQARMEPLTTGDFSCSPLPDAGGEQAV